VARRRHESATRNLRSATPRSTLHKPHHQTSRSFVPAGTAIEDAEGGDPQELYEREVAPALAARPDIWPAGSIASYDTFRRTAALVQSRAFHLNAENWVTGTVQVRQEPAAPHSSAGLPHAGLPGPLQWPAGRLCLLQALHQAGSPACLSGPASRTAQQHGLYLMLYLTRPWLCHTTAPATTAPHHPACHHHATITAPAPTSPASIQTMTLCPHPTPTPPPAGRL
jgi:hypothetical protein